jgi:hypothetical protein
MSRIQSAALLTAVFALCAARAASAQDTPSMNRDTTIQSTPAYPTPANPSAAAVTAIPSDTNANHQAEAVRHAQAAVDAGKTGDASAVAEHAQEALAHATQLQTERPGENIEKAVANLRDAITKGKSGDANGAMASAQEALNQLQPS